MLARNGKIAFVDSVGVQDVESGTPMAADSIFLIYSMTKPITAAALMILYEEGKWQIDEPVSNFIPEFADLRVPRRRVRRRLARARGGDPLDDDA